MVKAIAVDMDGTFLDSKKTYDKSRFEAIFTMALLPNLFEIY